MIELTPGQQYVVDQLAALPDACIVNVSAREQRLDSGVTIIDVDIHGGRHGDEETCKKCGHTHYIDARTGTFTWHNGRFRKATLWWGTRMTKRTIEDGLDFLRREPK